MRRVLEIPPPPSFWVLWILGLLGVGLSFAPVHETFQGLLPQAARTDFGAWILTRVSEAGVPPLEAARAFGVVFLGLTLVRFQVRASYLLGCPSLAVLASLFLVLLVPLRESASSGLVDLASLWVFFGLLPGPSSPPGGSPGASFLAGLWSPPTRVGFAALAGAGLWFPKSSREPEGDSAPFSAPRWNSMVGFAAGWILALGLGCSSVQVSGEFASEGLSNLKESGLVLALWAQVHGLAWFLPFLVWARARRSPPPRIGWLGGVAGLTLVLCLLRGPGDLDFVWLLPFLGLCLPILAWVLEVLPRIPRIFGVVALVGGGLFHQLGFHFDSRRGPTRSWTQARGELTGQDQPQSHGRRDWQETAEALERWFGRAGIRVATTDFAPLSILAPKLVWIDQTERTHPKATWPRRLSLEVDRVVSVRTLVEEGADAILGPPTWIHAPRPGETPRRREWTRLLHSLPDLEHLPRDATLALVFEGREALPLLILKDHPQFRALFQAGTLRPIPSPKGLGLPPGGALPTSPSPGGSVSS